MKKPFLLGCLLLTLASPTLRAVPFQNGDFESGNFTGWQGDLISTGIVDPDTDSHFTLTTSADPTFNRMAQVQNDDTDWNATLFQDFTLETLAPGETLDISFWIQWSPTDSTQDTISALLSDTGYMDTVDLLGAITDSELLTGTWVTVDVTPFARTWGGNDVELAFTISDGDFQTPDTMQIDNVRFTRHATVPAPATLLLFVAGLGGLAASGRNKRPGK